MAVVPFETAQRRARRPAPASRTLGALFAERSGAQLVGRRAELRALLDLVEHDVPVLAVVHGVAGVGKTSLLQTFQAAARERGAAVVRVDGAAVEPTPQGFTAALAAALGTTPGDVHAALGAHPGRTVITIDTAERLRLLDGWLRREFLPALPDTVRVAIATRYAPGAAWRAPFGDLLRAVPLGPLPPHEAAEVLREAGLDDRRAAWVNGFVRGHPLSLRLAASALLERPGAPEERVLPTVAQELAALYLDGVDPDTRAVLDATSVLRRVTCSLLAAVLPGVPAQDAFDRLARLPFVELGRDGLVVHDTVRDAIGARLRAVDPVRHRRLRTAAWRQIRHELEDAAGAARWSSLADMIELVDEPLVREAFFPATIQHYAVEPATPADRDEVEAIVARHEPEQHVELFRAWWAAVPDAFRVARGPRGDVVAFTALCEPSAVPSRLLATDPLCRGWRAHLRAEPVPRGQRILIARFALAWGTGAALSPCLSALLRDIERACLEAGPALRRVYGAYYGDDMLGQLAPLGWTAVAGASPVRLGDIEYGTIVCDLGPASVAGWLSGLAARDLSVHDVELVEDARELVLDGRRVPLTRLECDVLRYLQERERQAVSREALLRDVWGYEWTGGSNVVEVVISALRRKLGDRAAALETVRGVGYRLRPLAQSS